MRHVNSIAALAAAALWSVPSQAADPGAGTVNRMSAAAKPTMQLGQRQDNRRVEFDFGETKAWLQADGEWYVEGWVEHRGLRCGNYQLGIRFGAGNPACTNVVWTTEPRYVSFQKQCNNARSNHSGGDKDPALAGTFERISCAERLIKCSGNCK